MIDLHKEAVTRLDAARQIDSELTQIVELMQRPAELIERELRVIRDDGTIDYVPAWRCR